MIFTFSNLLYFSSSNQSTKAYKLQICASTLFKDKFLKVIGGIWCFKKQNGGILLNHYFQICDTSLPSQREYARGQWLTCIGGNSRCSFAFFSSLHTYHGEDI